MRRPLSTQEMNGLQLMFCPVCHVAYIRPRAEGRIHYCLQPICAKHAIELQHVNPFAIRRS